MSEPNEPQDQPETGFQWEVTGWSPQRPFGGQLVFSDGEYQIAADLDPMFVQELQQALTTVLDGQRAALGVRAPAEPDSNDADNEPVASREKAEDTRPWWRRHIVLAVLLVIVGGALLYSLITGGTSIQN